MSTQEQNTPRPIKTKFQMLIPIGIVLVGIGMFVILMGMDKSSDASKESELSNEERAQDYVSLRPEPASMIVKQVLMSSQLSTYVWYRGEIAYSKYTSDITPDNVIMERKNAVNWAESMDRIKIDSIVQVKLNELPKEIFSEPVQKVEP